MNNSGAVTSALWAHNSYESRKVGFWKCRSLSRKLSAPENAYPDPESLQILKIIIWIQNSCRSQNEEPSPKNLQIQKWRSGYGKLVDLDTENLCILIQKTCWIFIYLQVWPSFLRLHQLPLQVQNNTQFLNIKKQTSYGFNNKPLLDYSF
jgi:hypothetical protein